MFNVTVGVWVVFELGLRVVETVQGRGHMGRDRGSRILIALTLGGSIALAEYASAPARGLRIPAPAVALGVLVMWAGLVIRVWAVLTLGRSFRTTVEVDPEQAVVTDGPYHWVRHPSYSGLLLITFGFGLALHHWPALALCALGPVPAIVWRIHVEEAALENTLGEPYRALEAQTRRLIPGLW